MSISLEYLEHVSFDLFGGRLSETRAPHDTHPVSLVSGEAAGRATAGPNKPTAIEGISEAAEPSKGNYGFHPLTRELVQKVNGEVPLIEVKTDPVTGRQEIAATGQPGIRTPRADSLVIRDAVDWFRREAANVSTKIDPRLSLADQVIQAKQMQNALRQAAIDAIKVEESRLRFAQNFPEINLKDVYQKHAHLTGTALHQSVLAEITAGRAELKYPYESGGCFVAGTLIKTDRGDVPIEDIKPGDRVWSRPEEGGEASYRQVLETMVREGQELYGVEIFKGRDALDHAQYDWIFCTAEHPFWVEDKGWTTAAEVLENDFVQGVNSERYLVSRIFPVYATDTPGVGWVQDLDYDFYGSWNGDLIDFNGSAPKDIQVSVKHPAKDPYWFARNPARFATAVYNFSVEGFHTYFANGVWVHNTCPPRLVEETVIDSITNPQSKIKFIEKSNERPVEVRAFSPEMTALPHTDHPYIPHLDTVTGTDLRAGCQSA